MPLCHFTVLARFCTCRRLCGRVGGDTQPRPKPHPITSPDRPGLPDFSCETLKNMGRPGYEATEIIQQLWCQFFQLINTITAEEFDKFETEGKAWLTCFLSIYQTKNVTTYMHLMVAHLPEFIHIHGPISFTQQGLKGLMMCTFSIILGEATTQMLLRKNGVEYLSDSGYAREKRTCVCTVCSQLGHNNLYSGFI